ncbi:MAG: hypothetical protein ACRDQA_05475 [Nocardioidaceae bacterium]
MTDTRARLRAFVGENFGFTTDPESGFVYAVRKGWGLFDLPQPGEARVLDGPFVEWTAGAVLHEHDHNVKHLDRHAEDVAQAMVAEVADDGLWRRLDAEPRRSPRWYADRGLSIDLAGLTVAELEARSTDDSLDPPVRSEARKAVLLRTWEADYRAWRLKAEKAPERHEDAA